MHKDQEFEDGDIVVSDQHPGLGVIENWNPSAGGDVVIVRGLDGTIGEISFRLVRRATEAEEADYYRRKNGQLQGVVER